MAVYVAKQFHKNTLNPKKYKWMPNPLNITPSKRSNTTNCNLHCVDKTQRKLKTRISEHKC